LHHLIQTTTILFLNNNLPQPLLRTTPMATMLVRMAHPHLQLILMVTTRAPTVHNNQRVTLTAHHQQVTPTEHRQLSRIKVVALQVQEICWEVR